MMANEASASGLPGPAGRSTPRREGNVIEEMDRRNSILVTAPDKNRKKFGTKPRTVSFGPTEYAEENDTEHVETAEDSGPTVEKKIRLLQRTPTGRYHGRAPPKLQTDSASTPPEQSSPPIQVDLVQQELLPHHMGPTFRVEAVFHRASDESMGMSILSGSVDAQRGSRIGAIQAGSPVTRCVEGTVLVDDRLVEICGVDVCDREHEKVIEMLRQTTGKVKLVLERSTQFQLKKVHSEYCVRHGTGPIPAKKTLSRKKSGKSKKSFFSKDRKASRSGRDLPMSLARSDVILVHRHPNSNGLQIGIRGGVEDGSFPKILTAVHPRSPFAPLVEGGVLGNEYELLEINGNVSLGMPHDDLISALKDVGDEVQLRVIPPAMRNRQLVKLFNNPAQDDETELFMDRLRRAMYTRLVCVTTQPIGFDGKSLPGLSHVTEAQFSELASRDKLYEWVLHENGYFYGLPIEARGRPASSAPFELAPALDELYPIPPAPERMVSPVRPVRPASSEKAASPQKMIEVQPTPADGEVVAETSPTKVQVVTPSPVQDIQTPNTLANIIERMQETTDRLRSKIAAREAAGESVNPDSSDPALAQAVASLQELHLSCAQALIDGDVPTSTDTPAQYDFSEKAEEKFVFKAESPSAKKRQMQREATGRRGGAVTPETVPPKRSRTSEANIGEPGSADALGESVVDGLGLDELFVLVQEHTQSIQAISDTPAAAQHCHVILSAVTKGRTLLNPKDEGKSVGVSPVVLEIAGADEAGRDSGLAPDGDSPDATTTSPSLEPKRRDLDRAREATALRSSVV